MWQTNNIFHEKQDGRLCAQHCLNALLQGSYYTAVSLSELGIRLDDEERQRMAENENISEYNRFLEQPSENMDDTGDFSVQVLCKALEVWNLELIPFMSTDPRAFEFRLNPSAATAYIMNVKNHWHCIRRFGTDWFDLNSMLSHPKHIDYDLLYYLYQMSDAGNVFIVIGQLPECASDISPPTIIITPPQPMPTIPDHRPLTQSDQLNTVLEISRALGNAYEQQFTSNSRPTTTNEIDDYDEELAAALALSMQTL